MKVTLLAPVPDAYVRLVTCACTTGCCCKPKLYTASWKCRESVIPLWGIKRGDTVTMEFLDIISPPFKRNLEGHLGDAEVKLLPTPRGLWFRIN